MKLDVFADNSYWNPDDCIIACMRVLQSKTDERMRDFLTLDRGKYRLLKPAAYQIAKSPRKRKI